MNNREKIVINETKKYLVFDYQDDNQVNNLLNDWFSHDKLIIIDKKDDDNIIIKLEKDNYSLNNKNVSLNEDLNKIIDLFHISNNIRMTIKKNTIKLYSENYKNIFDNLFVKGDSYYLFNINREEELYREISKYNKYTSMISYKDIDKIFDEFDVLDIEKYINGEVNNIVIKNDNDGVKLYIDNDKCYLFTFVDKNMFDNIYLPEIIKMYSSFNKLNKIEKDKQFNKCYANINDNFYLIDFKEEELDGCFEFIKNVDRKNNYKLDMDSNYTFIKETEEEKINYSYSYGYVSIIFISFVMSIITIIVVLMNS